jgi:hypothetical protein
MVAGISQHCATVKSFVVWHLAATPFLRCVPSRGLLTRLYFAFLAAPEEKQKGPLGG